MTGPTSRVSSPLLCCLLYPGQAGRSVFQALLLLRTKGSSRGSPRQLGLLRADGALGRVFTPQESGPSPRRSSREKPVGECVQRTQRASGLSECLPPHLVFLLLLFLYSLLFLLPSASLP